MVRATRAAGPGSGPSGDRSKKNIGRVRTKRKRRKKDLEELHRNVLEAKRISRFKGAQRKTRGKTDFAKVLTNFADKRRENANETQGIGGGNESTRTKMRKICERLLPEPMVGMYANGAKGREIRRVGGLLNETNVARLRGNVLRLLKGDETNPKPSREREDEKIESDRPSDESEKSDSPTEIGRLVGHNHTLGRTKGVKRMNSERGRTIALRNEPGAKDRPTELPRQREEDKCKRRLFEPNDEDETDENSFGIIDRSAMTNGETRFTSRKWKKPVAGVRSKSPDNDVETRAEKSEEGSREIETVLRRKVATDGEPMNDNFWGWSPMMCYERLCATISIDNFENGSHLRRAPDRIVKIQKILRGIYAQNDRRSRLNRIEPSKKSPFADPSGSISNSDDTIEIQACTQNSENSSSTDGSDTIIGSWRSINLEERYAQDNSGIFVDDNEIIRRTKLGAARKDEESTRDDEPPLNNGNYKNVVSSMDPVQRTIDSVGSFLRQLNRRRSFVRSEKNNMFEMEIDRARRPSRNHEKLENYLGMPVSDLKLGDNRNDAPRRNSKHVPTILRRSNGHSESVETILPVDEPSKRLRRDAKRRGPAIFVSSPVHRPVPVALTDKENLSLATFAPSPCPSTMTFGDEENYHRTPARESRKKLVEQQQLDRANVRKSKLNFTRGKYPRLSFTEELKTSEDNEHGASLSDRNVEIESRDFFKPSNMENNPGRNRLICQDDVGSKYRRKIPNEDPGRDAANEEKKVTFFDDSIQFFDNYHKNPDNNAERPDPTNLHRPLPDHNQRRACFPSFEFQLPETDPGRAINDPRDIATKFTLRESLISRSISETPTEVRARTPRRRAEAESRIFARSLANFQQPRENPCDRGPVKKRVVLFRPIEEKREKILPQSDTRDPHSCDNAPAMTEAVRNLRVMDFESNIKEEEPAVGTERVCYRPSRQKRVFHDRCDRRQWTSDARRQREIENFQSHSQPTKFLAFDGTNGSTPRRIRIYAKVNVPPANNNQRDVSNVATMMVGRRPDGTELTYVRSIEAARGNKVECLEARLVEQRRVNSSCCPREPSDVCASRNIYEKPDVFVRAEDGRSEQRSRVVLAAPLRRPLHLPQTVNDPRALLAPWPERRSTATREEPRRETNVNCVGDFGEPDDPARRIQLPDGRFAIFVSVNSSNDNSSQLLYNDASRGSNVTRINGPNSNAPTERYLYDFPNNDEIYSQSGYQWNRNDSFRRDYDPNEAYYRATRANGTFRTTNGR